MTTLRPGGQHEFIAERHYRNTVLWWFPLRNGVVRPLHVDVQTFAEGDDVVRGQDPTLTLPDNAAQALMDALWLSGVRPSRAGDPSSVQEATLKHLEDMRTLVFDRHKRRMERP